MIWLLLIPYFAVWGLTWWMSEDYWLDEFGEVNLSDRVFFIIYSLFLPISTVAVGVTWLNRKRRHKPRILRTREKSRYGS